MASVTSNPIDTSEIKVYLLQSTDALHRIESNLAKLGKYAHVGIIYRRNSTTREREPTKDKSLLLCTEEFADSISKSSLGYKILEYNWDTFPNPRTSEGETYDLHITGIPNTVRQDEVIGRINNYVAPLGLSEDMFSIDMRVESRTTGFATGFGTIKFKPEVPEYTRKLFKLILHNREFDGFKYSNKFINCTWHNPTITRNIRQSRAEPKSATSSSAVAVPTQPVKLIKSFRPEPGVRSRIPLEQQ